MLQWAFCLRHKISFSNRDNQSEWKLIPIYEECGICDLRTLSHLRMQKVYENVYHNKHKCAYVISLFPLAPNLEHKATVKRFASLQFRNPKRVSGTPWMGDQSVKGRYLHRTTQTQNKPRQTSILLSGIRTHGPSVRANEDSSYLRPRGHCNRLNMQSSIWCFLNTVNKSFKRTLSEVLVCFRQKLFYHTHYLNFHKFTLNIIYQGCQRLFHFSQKDRKHEIWGKKKQASKRDRNEVMIWKGGGGLEVEDVAWTMTLSQKRRCKSRDTTHHSRHI
jgi:hypothetical protein